jgi:UDP-glucose:(heptosyl)LPS alpha-1,3-glucosyltransferase
MGLAIALIRQRYAADGGAERFVSRALDALKAQGVAVTLIAREWRGTAGLATVTCNPFYLGRLWRDWSFARCVCRTVNRRRFDIVQSHERIACCDVYRAGDGVHREWLKQRARVLGPFGRLGQAINPYHYYIKHAERRLFLSPRLKAVICNSHMVKHEIQRHFRLAETKLHVIYNGVDIEAFHPRLREHRSALRARYGIDDAARLFVFVGSGFERKGLRTVLEALALLPAAARLIVVGRDKHRTRYERHAASLGLGSRVQFVGVQADVRPFYGAADALVLPTLYDPFPNVVVEAMASGLGVIVSRKCGAAELVEPSGSGVVCDAGDAAALARAMERFLAAEQAQRFGAAARRVAEGLSLNAMADQLVRLYEQLT